MVDRVLLVVEKFCSADPKYGVSNWDYLVVQSLKDSGLAPVIEMFYFDVISRQVGPSAMGELLLERCCREQPDLVVIAPGGWFDLDPPRGTINIITKTLGIKVLMVRSDSGGVEGTKWTDTWFPFVDSIVFIDVALSQLGDGQHPTASQGFSCRANANFFYGKEQKRDIGVSFVGSIADWPRRAEYIGFLREHGVKITTRGGQNFDLISPEEYAGIIKRSKISLNFCLHTGETFPQVKGRVFEVTACRTLLIEDEGTETRRFFDEGKDFVMVRSKEEMLEQVNYYLRHDGERERIAESGCRKTNQLYNGRNLWGYIFTKMGFGIPEGLSGDKHYREAYRKLESLRWEGINV